LLLLNHLLAWFISSSRQTSAPKPRRQESSISTGILIVQSVRRCTVLIFLILIRFAVEPCSNLRNNFNAQLRKHSREMCGFRSLIACLSSRFLACRAVVAKGGARRSLVRRRLLRAPCHDLPSPN